MNTQCRPLQGEGYTYYSRSRRPEAPPVQRKLIREGFFALRLAEAMKVGEVKSEAEAESRLASMGILPRNGWIADYPLTPKVIAELEGAIGGAADSGKLAMKKDEALNVFRDLVASIENEQADTEPPPGDQSHSEEYADPGSYYYPYFYPYYYPYPYSFGYYRFHRYPYFRHWR